MAINVSFNGATIYKPGAYSKQNIDLGGGFPVGPAGLIAVIGEADGGAPGSQEINIANNRFSADQISSIRNKYGSGQIVDASGMLFAPAADAGIPGGAQTVWFYKTNESTRASLALAGPYGTARAREWGVGGNKVTLSNILTAEVAATTSSAAPFDETLVAAGSISARVDGGAAVALAVSAPYANKAAVTADAIAWGIAQPGLTFVVGGVDGAVTLTVSRTANASTYTLGHGRSFELSGAPLAALGLTAGMWASSAEPTATLTLKQLKTGLTESATMSGDVVMKVRHNGSGGVTSASVAVSAANITLTTNLGSVVLPKAGFTTIKDVASEVALQAGWSATISDSKYNNLSPSVLDNATTGAFSAVTAGGARLKKDASDVASFFADSSLAEILSQVALGLPAALSETIFAGGARGATTTASIVAALEKFEKFHVNSIVPLMSRDASADISDGLTDSGSTYTIDGIHQAVKTHISLMKTTKKRSERQGYMSLKANFATCKTKAGDMGDGRQQLAIQDIRQADSTGTIKWFQPWALACLLAGSRGGSPIGEPMTFKFMNCSGIRHTAQPMSTPDANIVTDFDPDLQTDEAIQAGITFLENPQTGGFRVVVDNTTYGIDGNFVWNRANVVYAADIVAFNFRNAMESIFVGKKNTVSVADISSTAATILNTFLAQGVTVSTPDAPQGFKNLVVRLEGNTIYVEMIIKIVEGIDFVLADITIQRATA